MKTGSKIRPTVKNAIIDAAIAVMAENPGATLSEIALTAGVGRATLHRHFRSREDLIKSIITQCINETEACFDADDLAGKTSLEKLQTMFVSIIPLGDRFHFLNKETSHDEALRERYEAELDWVKKLVLDLRTDKHLCTDVPVSWQAAQIDQLVWVAWREVAVGNIALAAAPDLAIRTLLKGLS